jgi:transcriptional regulator with XRE-family HTH domain
MLNTDAFAERLLKIMQSQHLSASQLAEKLGVQRSGISHILSGRNKPGLEFVLRLHESFPEFDLPWLLTGKSQAAPAPMPEIARIIVFYRDGSFSEYAPK